MKAYTPVHFLRTLPLKIVFGHPVFNKQFILFTFSCVLLNLPCSLTHVKLKLVKGVILKFYMFQNFSYCRIIELTEKECLGKQGFKVQPVPL